MCSSAKVTTGASTAVAGGARHSKRHSHWHLSDLGYFSHFKVPLFETSGWLTSPQDQPAKLSQAGGKTLPELIAGTKPTTQESWKRSLQVADAHQLHLRRRTGLFKNFLNISCKFPEPPTGAAPSLVRLSLNSFIFLPQI